MAESPARFDEERWEKVIKRPDWYLEFVPYALQTLHDLDGDQDAADEFKKTARHFFEAALVAGSVAIGDAGPDFDRERQLIDTVVIHHTSHTPGYRLDYLNAVHLLNIYAPYYANPSEQEAELRGQPIWSGHFYDGRQVFWGYHWIMRMDGSFERLLSDDQIGWQAGNWDINTRSVGICIDNDYENQDPEDQVLRKLAAYIRQTYPDIKTSGVIGHSQARAGTICPGANFINSWRPKLLKYLADGP